MTPLQFFFKVLKIGSIFLVLFFSFMVYMSLKDPNFAKSPQQKQDEQQALDDKLIKDKEKAAIKKHELFVGMSENAVHKSWGRGNETETHNTLGTMIYIDYSNFGPGTNAIIQNGKLISWTGHYIATLGNF